MFTQFIPACLDAHKTFVLTKSHSNLLILASGEIETEFWALFHAVDAFVDFAHSVCAVFAPPILLPFSL